MTCHVLDFFLKNISRIYSIVVVAVLAQILLFGGAFFACAETYSWTDADGSIHFTDDPGKVSKKAHRTAIDPTETSTVEIPDIVGSWSNRKNSFGTLLMTFHADRTGDMVTAIGMRVPFSWLVRADGSISLELREPPEMSRRGQRVQTHTLLAEYDRARDVLTINDETKQKKLGTLYPEEDGRSERQPNRPHAPRRFSFEETTVRDTLTGLTWARSLDLPGSLRRHRNSGQFLMELNDRGYGDMVDWRLPSVGEMQELIQTLQDFGRESGRSAAAGTVPELLKWVGFTNPKGRCYWTSTEGEGTGERYSYSLEDEEQRSFGHKQTCGIWPVRGNRK